MSFSQYLTIISIMDLFNEEQKIALSFIKDNMMVEMVCSIDKIYEDRLSLNLPQYFMRYINYLQVGNRVTAKVFSKLGTIDFNTVIITSPLEDAFFIELDYNSLKLTPTSEIPVINATESLTIIKNSEVFNLKTLEISTDYIKFYSDKKFNLEEAVDCNINLSNNYGTIKFKATISGIDEVYDNEYTASFTTMTENDRQTLLYYMYMYTKDFD